MWTREQIKTRAKKFLAIAYWKAFLISMIILIAGGGKGNGGSSSRSSGDPSNHISKEYITMVLMMLGIVLLLRILIGYMLEIGGRKFFVQGASGEIKMGYIGFAFGEGNYFNVLKTMFLRDIYLILWTLLLIIPGIIKSYSYRMVPYILADNPNIGANRAIELSNEMTQGEKWNIFVLDLSFLGWYLLGMLALLVGVLFVVPYDDATNAELYLVFRKDAIACGKTSYEELNLSNLSEQPTV